MSKRWNGWGDEAISIAIDPAAQDLLKTRLGSGVTPHDTSFDAACQQIAASRLAPHTLIATDAQTRLLHGFGQSLPEWLKLRYGRIGCVPDGVAYPQSNEEVRTLLDYAKAQQARVIPYGGGTSVVGHLSAPQGDQPVLSISLQRLSGLIELDKEAQLARFGAGVTGPDLEAQLRAQGYTLGHFPQSFEYSTLGGWVVTRSSGQQSLRYGRIEQLFAGGRLESPVGTLNVPTFPASAAGCDLREMILGSEGRLGILTEATVRITALPEHEAFHTFFFPDWERAVLAVRTLAQAKLPLSMLRLSNALETDTSLLLAGRTRLIGLLRRYLKWRGCGEAPCMLLVGLSGARSLMNTALKLTQQTVTAHQGVHVGKAIGEKWKHGRFRNVYLRNALWEKGYAVDTVETAVDWPRVTSMMHEIEHSASNTLRQLGVNLYTYTHLSHMYGEGASVYTTFIYPLAGQYERDLEHWRALKAAASQAIVRMGGTISHQHGVGTDHAPYLADEKGALGLGALRQLFHYFDPDAQMNPGKLITP